MINLFKKQKIQIGFRSVICVSEFSYKHPASQFGSYRTIFKNSKWRSSQFNDQFGVEWILESEINSETIYISSTKEYKKYFKEISEIREDKIKKILWI